MCIKNYEELISCIFYTYPLEGSRVKVVALP
jgi:hypothetical protein